MSAAKSGCFPFARKKSPLSRKKAAAFICSLLFCLFLASLLVAAGGCKHLSDLYVPSSYTIDTFYIDPDEGKMEVLNGYKNYAGKVIKVSPANGINWSDNSRSIFLNWDQHEAGQHLITITMSVMIEKPVSSKAQISAYKPAPKIWASPSDIEWKGPPNIGWTVENENGNSGQFGGKPVEIPQGQWVDLTFTQAVSIAKSGQIYLDGHSDHQGLIDTNLYIRNFQITMVKTERYIALTFNDSPTDFTDFLLDKLDELGVKATFFITGMGMDARHPVFDRAVKEDLRQQKTEERKATLTRMVEEGYEIGNLSYSSNYLGGGRLDGTDGIDQFIKKSDIPVLPGYTVTSYPLSESAVRRELEDTQIAIQKAVYGDTDYLNFPWVSQYARIPYGADLSKADNFVKAARELGLPIIMGTDPGGAQSEENIGQKADTISREMKSWTINVSKDPRTDPYIIKVLNVLIPKLIHEGYEFVTVGEMSALSKTSLVPGKVYYNLEPEQP